MTTLKAFISYKWEDDAHNRWVERFASDLRAFGIDTILDRWEVRFGDSFTDYMTSKIAEADVVLFVMTTRSVAAAEAPKGQGGAVKFEMQMATSRRIAGERMRLIGIYREGSKTAAHLRDHRYADFRDNSKYHDRLEELINDLLGVDLKPHLNTSKGVVQARIILNSGCFLPIPKEDERKYLEIGYFQSGKSISDINIQVDGRNLVFPMGLNMGKKCIVEVLHKKADGKINKKSLRFSDTLNNDLLHLKELYGRNVSVDRSKFDCLVRFNSGYFSPMLIQPVAFRELSKQSDGMFSLNYSYGVKQVKPCAHVIVGCD